MTEIVKYQKFAEGYAEICLNRPEKHNAISKEMAKELRNSLEKAKKETIKFLVLTGSGNKMFCAGGDLNYLHGELTPDEAFFRLSTMKEVLYEIVSFPVPVICLLNGDGLGGGCEIATACDIRIAKKTAKFGFVQSNLGILPGWGGGALLYEKVNPSFALRWLMEANMFNAIELKENGWIHHLVCDENWNHREAILTPYITKSYSQMKILKRQYLNKLSGTKLSSIMCDEVRSSAGLWDSKEHKDAVLKFQSRERF
ncbi:enoyl-CoA hydratase/isomerase family protein [Virgibacillus ainsalahensis]